MNYPVIIIQSFCISGPTVISFQAKKISELKIIYISHDIK